MSDSSSDELDLPGASRPNIALPRRRAVNLSSSSSSSDDIAAVPAPRPAPGRTRASLPSMAPPAKVNGHAVSETTAKANRANSSTNNPTVMPNSTERPTHGGNSGPPSTAPTSVARTPESSKPRTAAQLESTSSSSAVDFHEEDDAEEIADGDKMDETPELDRKSIEGGHADMKSVEGGHAAIPIPPTSTSRLEPATQPAMQPATQPAMQPATQPATQPEAQANMQAESRPTVFHTDKHSTAGQMTSPSPDGKMASDETRHEGSSRQNSPSPAQRPPPNPTRRVEDDDVLLTRVADRLQRRSSRPTSRASTPTRASSRLRETDGSHSHSQELGVLEASRDRLLRENLRLADEVAFLIADKEKVKGAVERCIALDRQLARIEIESQSLKRRAEESAREHARTKLALEQRLKNSLDHNGQLQDELDTSRAAVAHFEALLNEKERALSAEVAIASNLRADLRDLSHEIKSVREDSARQHDDDTSRMEQLSEMLADAKKQRLVLLDLNDRCTREKENAEAERRSVEDRLRQQQQQHSSSLARLQSDLQTCVAREAATKLDREKLIAQHSDEAELLRRTIHETTTQLAHLEGKAHHADTEAQRAEKSNRDAAESEIVQLSQRTIELSTELDETKDELARAVIEIDRLRHTNSQNHVAIEEDASLRTELASEKARTTELRATVSARNAEVQELNRRLQSEIETRVLAQEETVKAKSRFAALRESMDKLLASDDQLAEENEELYQRVSSLEQEVEDLTSQSRSFENNASMIRELQLENDRLQSQATRLHADRTELAHEVDRLRNELRSSYRADATPKKRLPNADFSS